MDYFSEMFWLYNLVALVLIFSFAFANSIGYLRQDFIPAFLIGLVVYGVGFNGLYAFMYFT